MKGGFHEFSVSKKCDTKGHSRDHPRNLSATRSFSCRGRFASYTLRVSRKPITTRRQHSYGRVERATIAVGHAAAVRAMPAVQCHIARGPSPGGPRPFPRRAYAFVLLSLGRARQCVIYCLLLPRDDFPARPWRAPWRAEEVRGVGDGENALYSRLPVTLRAAVSHHVGTTTHDRSVNPEKTTSHRARAHAPRLRASFCVQCVRAPSW